jgi:hypothetical protein
MSIIQRSCRKSIADRYDDVKNDENYDSLENIIIHLRFVGVHEK